MKEASQEEFNEFSNAIGGNDGDRVIELAAKNPALLTKRTSEGANFWILVGSSPKVEQDTIEAVAIAAFRNLKNIPGGYDSFFFAQDVNGDTAVQVAVKKGQNAHAKLLVNTYETLLVKKAKLPDAEVQKRVAALINTPDSNGRTVLYHVPIADFISGEQEFWASKGSDFNSIDKERNTPALYSCGRTLKNMSQKGAPLTALKAWFTMDEFVMRGADPRQRNNAGETLASLGQTYSKGWTDRHTRALLQVYESRSTGVLGPDAVSLREEMVAAGQAITASKSSSNSRSESSSPSQSSSRSESTPPPSSRESTPPPPVVGPRTAALEKEKAQKQDQVGKSGCCSIL